MTTHSSVPNVVRPVWEVDDPSGVDAVGADGGMVHIRPVAPGDAEALRALHWGVFDYSLYMRFFGFSRSAAMNYVTRLVAGRIQGIRR